MTISEPSDELVLKVAKAAFGAGCQAVIAKDDLLEAWHDFEKAIPELIKLNGGSQSDRVRRLEEALREIMSLEGEINPSNYDHDDVCYLNSQFIESFNIARTALGEPQC